MSIYGASYVSLSKRYFEWWSQEFPQIGTTLIEGSQWEVLHINKRTKQLLVAGVVDGDLHWFWVNADLVDKVEDVDSN